MDRRRAHAACLPVRSILAQDAPGFDGWGNQHGKFDAAQAPPVGLAPEIEAAARTTFFVRASTTNQRRTHV
jgi:hypothetical protein